MKSIKSLFSLSAIAAVAILGAASAQAELTILTVSVGRAADQYYKVQDLRQELEADQQKAQEQAGKISEEGKGLEQQFRELVQQAQSDILTEDARKDAANDAEAKRQEILLKQNELNQYIQSVQRQAAARQSTQMTLFTKDIMEVITEISKERNATLVLDTSGASQNGMPTVLSFDDSIDITEEVIKRINADQPAPAAAE